MPRPLSRRGELHPGLARRPRAPAGPRGRGRPGPRPTNSYVRRSSAAGSWTQRSNWSTSTGSVELLQQSVSSCRLYRLRARDSFASMAPKYSTPSAAAPPDRTIASSCLSPDWKRCRGSLSRTRILASGAALRSRAGVQNPCMYSGDHSPDQGSPRPGKQPVVGVHVRVGELASEVARRRSGSPSRGALDAGWSHSIRYHQVVPARCAPTPTKSGGRRPNRAARAAAAGRARSSPPTQAAQNRPADRSQHALDASSHRPLVAP